MKLKKSEINAMIETRNRMTKTLKQAWNLYKTESAKHAPRTYKLEEIEALEESRNAMNNAIRKETRTK